MIILIPLIPTVRTHLLQYSPHPTYLWIEMYYPPNLLYPSLGSGEIDDNEMQEALMKMGKVRS